MGSKNTKNNVECEESQVMLLSDPYLKKKIHIYCTQHEIT